MNYPYYPYNYPYYPYNTIPLHCIHNLVGAEGLEPTNLTDVNRAL